MITLYYSPGSASLLVHWLLVELDMPHDLVRVDLDNKQQKSPDYLALNPIGVVPTLVIDGVAHHEAAAMALLLAERAPGSGLAPAPGDEARADFLQWMFDLANAVQPLFRIWWYPHEVLGDSHVDEVRASVAPRIAAAWDRIDSHLSAHGPWLLGATMTVADFYLAMLMRWSRQMPRPATAWPSLSAHAQRMTSRASFAELSRREGISGWP